MPWGVAAALKEPTSPCRGPSPCRVPSACLSDMKGVWCVCVFMYVCACVDCINPHPNLLSDLSQRQENGEWALVEEEGTRAGDYSLWCPGKSACHRMISHEASLLPCLGQHWAGLPQASPLKSPISDCQHGPGTATVWFRLSLPLLLISQLEATAARGRACRCPTSHHSGSLRMLKIY